MAKAIYPIVMNAVYHHIDGEYQQLMKQYDELPLSTVSHSLSQTLLNDYKTRLEGELEAIRTQQEQIKSHIDVIQPHLLNTRFVTDFAAYFQTIDHLAYALSDAPPAIKALDVALYREVLYKLPPKDQEQQLKNLSFITLKTLIDGMIHSYDATENGPLKCNYQRLVHMGIFELIRRDVALAAATPDLPYDVFLQTLTTKIPNVGASPIIDTISDYRDTTGRSINALLHTINSPYKTATADMLLHKKALYHSLRFGQEDRRDYLRKRQENMARDLFWARNIRDIELFATKANTDGHLKYLAEQRYFKADTLFKKTQQDTPTNIPKKHAPKIQKLIKALKQVQDTRKLSSPPLFPIGDKAHRLDVSARNSAIQSIKHALEREVLTPAITLGDDAQLTVDFFYCDFSPAHLEKLLDTILTNGGFGQLPATMVGGLAKETELMDHIHTLTLHGESLASITATLRTEDMDPIAKARYLTILDHTNTTLSAHSPTSLEALHLSTTEEITLSKLLEIQFFIQQTGAEWLPEALLPSFEHIKRGDYQSAAQSSPIIEEAISLSYQHIAHTVLSSDRAIVTPVIEKAKIISNTATERKDKLDRFTLLCQSTDIEDCARGISELFLEEYNSVMSDRSDDARLKASIEAMAQDFSRLLCRTRQGLPILTPDEERHACAIIEHIKAILEPETFQQATFKIKHDLHGKQLINLILPWGEERSLYIDLGYAPLPYSLIKPPHGDRILLSYGGTRGIIGPFEGLDEAYASPSTIKQRLFTHSRLPGLGQYGSVREVEDLITGLHDVIKQGYPTPTDKRPTFQEAARTDLKTRLITARNDPLYRIESDILSALSKTKLLQSSCDHHPTQLWMTHSKIKKSGRLFQRDGRVAQYHLLTDRAKGDTYADVANQELNSYFKGDLAYHDPRQRRGDLVSPIALLKELLNLSQSLVQEADAFEQLGFAHNDIKPENFLSLRHADGHYSIQYIDWATGGFQQPYTGKGRTPIAIFEEIFGTHHEDVITLDETIVKDTQGRFVIHHKTGFDYGINPTLEIRHGARHGSLPYISPEILGETRSLPCFPAGTYHSDHHTQLNTHDPVMDNWSLTAMIFGLCNRHAYFSLIKGRIVSDYVIPGILESDDEHPWGLKITDTERFNAFFSCRPSDVISEETLSSKEAYRDPRAVMYIPSNQREGEPLHLYRRLVVLQNTLKDPTLQSLLDRIYNAASLGKGLAKSELLTMIGLLNKLINDYEKRSDLGYQRSLRKAEWIESILEKHPLSSSHADDYLQKCDGAISDLEALCTYSSEAQQKRVLARIDRVMTESQLYDKCFIPSAPLYHLFKAMITAKQSTILITLLNKIQSNPVALMDMVTHQGLIQYTLQQGLTDVTKTLLDALKRAGAEEESISKLCMSIYDKDSKQAHIQWAIPAVHMAIQNHDEEQLTLLLPYLPKHPQDITVIYKALHLCATLSNAHFFYLILSHYNDHHPETPITLDHLLTWFDPTDQTFMYPLFLRDERTIEAIDWNLLKKNPTLAERFLLDLPHHNDPSLLAAEHQNSAGILALLDLADSIGLSPEKKRQLLTRRDPHGKTCLNHFLEQKCYDLLMSWIIKVQSMCGRRSSEIVMILLNNPSPVNPLKNALLTNPDPRRCFGIMTQLLDACCAHFVDATDAQQHTRISNLLINTPWLIQQAEDHEQHRPLRQLLQNAALPIPHKHILFSSLQQASEPKSTAYQFYTLLLSEVSPPQCADSTQQIKRLLPNLLRHIAHQEANPLILIESFTEEIQTLTLRYEQRIMRLQKAHEQEMMLLSAHERPAAQKINDTPIPLSEQRAWSAPPRKRALPTTVHLQVAISMEDEPSSEETECVLTTTPREPRRLFQTTSLHIPQYHVQERKALSFHAFFLKFKDAFKATNSDGIKQMIGYMKALLMENISDETRFDRLSQHMHQIAKDRVNRAWSKSHFIFKGRTTQVQELYDLMAKEDFSLMHRDDQTIHPHLLAQLLPDVKERFTIR